MDKATIMFTHDLLNKVREREIQVLKDVILQCCGGDWEFDEDSAPVISGFTRFIDNPVDFSVRYIEVKDNELVITGRPFFGDTLGEEEEISVYRIFPHQLIDIAEGLYDSWKEFTEELEEENQS